MGATGESAKRLTDFGFDPAWSPDGKEIVFALRGFENPRRLGLSAIYAVTVASSEIRKITTNLDDAVQPSWSPHGNRIAFWSIRAGDSTSGVRHDIWTVPAAGGKAIRVTNDPASYWIPRWSPDGKRILFYSNRVTGRNQIWAINPDGSGLQQLGETDQSTRGPVSSPDGKRVAYGSNIGNFISELGKPWKDRTERLPAFSESELFTVSSWSPTESSWREFCLESNPATQTIQTATPCIPWRPNDLRSSRILDGCLFG